MRNSAQDLQAARLRAAYLAGEATPESVIDAVYARIAERGDDHVWISLVPRDEALARARELGRCHGELPALFGLPFAVKDNIDVAGLPTTAACPSFGYLPTVSAPLVTRLLAAGAICIGKTNLDQFATGLTGTRSPYGTPRSPFGADLIPGGSSSGSGVAVAAGLVTFAIGTDTAGSGRVPAALTNTVGLKPTRGLVSGRGMVPACRSLDCPSVFALSVADAQAVLSVIAGYDADDPWSRRLPAVPATLAAGVPRRVGVLPAGAREFFGDTGAAAGYETALELLAEAGATCVPFDVEPFLAAGTLLYGGPWLAERTAAIGSFLDAHRDEIHPVTRAVLAPGATITGAEVFQGIATLRALRRQVDACWDGLDMIAVPTVPTTYTLAEVAADPVTLNTSLGRYTTFANLLDLAAVAVPAGFAAGLPFGVTLAGPAGSDQALCALAADLHARAGLPVGAGKHPLAPLPVRAPPARTGVELVVVGAHMSGLGLNGQLTSLGGTLVRQARTRADYRLFALPGTEPARPGLVRVGQGGVAIEAEIWRLPADAVGTFLAGVPAPLAIGTVALDRGDSLGFLCEAHATAGALDISSHGGWRAYLASLASLPT